MLIRKSMASRKAKQHPSLLSQVRMCRVKIKKRTATKARNPGPKAQKTETAFPHCLTTRDQHAIEVCVRICRK